jgi:predicted phage terminase large subunit-like protein
LGSYGYASQFQQNPVARGGNLFKEDWFGTFLESPKFDRIIQSWDTAYKTGNANDYSACVTIGLVRERCDGSTAIPGYYLVHAWHGRIEFADLKRRAIDFYNLWHPEAVLVEDSASGQSLLQELRSNTTLPIVGVKPESDKFTRATSVTPALEAGCFRLLDGAPWASFYLAEMTAFPGGAHDDLVDATVQALTYLRASQDPAMLILYRELAQQAGMPPPSADGRPLRNPCDRCGLEIVGSRIEQGPLKFHIDCHRLWENGQ